MRKRILVTGCAGFIGSNLVDRLLSEGYEVIGVDNFDPFYDRTIKEFNLKSALSSSDFELRELDILDDLALGGITDVDLVIHLAAKAGVRPSIENPDSYLETNIEGTHSILKWMRSSGCSKIIFASSSSVYGNNKEMPFTEDHLSDAPISPYAASKKACELLNHTYHAIYGLGVLNFRLFTVYGPRQRPDLAIRKFIDLVSKNEEIPVYGKGDTYRDYTFVGDVVNGFLLGVNYLFTNPTAYETVNIASGKPIGILELIECITSVMNKEGAIRHLPMQSGDVDHTFANIEKASDLLNFHPSVEMKEGVGEFLHWIRESSIK